MISKMLKSKIIKRNGERNATLCYASPTRSTIRIHGLPPDVDGTVGQKIRNPTADFTPDTKVSEFIN